ncbi:MAG TPA: MFS transporter [Steroidobacteraceae bacterium]|nr:MFS transporter [Steroidobacteraceae bacterium]
MNNDLKRRVAEGPLTKFQLFAVGVCVCLNMLDGFDILAMSFAASGVKTDWHLGNSQLGYLFSAGLVGMGIGSLTIAPWADRFGRRPIVLLSAAIAGLSMVGSAIAPGFVPLLALRVFTGIGIGGTIASVAVLVSEYAPDRWRSVALAIYATGYSIGAALGGVLTALAVQRFGWRSAFAIGGVLSLAVIPVGWRRLPESLDFLLTRRPESALRRVNDLLAAMGQAALRVLPEFETTIPDAQAAHGAIGLLITRTTLLAWFAFFCTMAGFYFIMSWTPRLLTAAGLSADQGLTGGILLSVGGIIGCGLYAWAASRVNARLLLTIALLTTALLISAFGLSMSNLTAALWTALFLGMIANGAMAGLYTVGPTLYPTPVRATGMGSTIGIGRFGAILAPIVSGALLDSGWTPAHLYVWFAIPYVLAALAMVGIKICGSAWDNPPVRTLDQESVNENISRFGH